MCEKNMRGSDGQEEKSGRIRPPTMVKPVQGDQEAIRNQPSIEYHGELTGIQSPDKNSWSAGPCPLVCGIAAAKVIDAAKTVPLEDADRNTRPLFSPAHDNILL